MYNFHEALKNISEASALAAKGFQRVADVIKKPRRIILRKIKLHTTKRRIYKTLVDMDIL